MLLKMCETVRGCKGRRRESIVYVNYFNESGSVGYKCSDIEAGVSGGVTDIILQVRESERRI